MTVSPRGTLTIKRKGSKAGKRSGWRAEATRRRADGKAEAEAGEAQDARKAVRALRSGAKLTVRLTVDYADAAGNEQSLDRKVVLKPKKKRK